MKRIKAWAWKWNDQPFPDLTLIRMDRANIGEIRRCPSYGAVVEVEIRELKPKRGRRGGKNV